LLQVPLAAKAAKIIAQDPLACSAPSQSTAAAQVPSRLVVYDFVEIRASADRVLRFFDKAKTAAEEWDSICLDSFWLDHNVYDVDSSSS
jgi:hypothetical protein